MEDPRKFPEPAPEVGPEASGSRWVTMPEVGRLLGMSERGARDWVKRRAIPAHGTRPVRVSEQAVLAAMAAEERVPRKSPGTSPEASGASPEVSSEAPGSGPEAIEATFRPAGTPVAVSPAAYAQLEAIRDQWLAPLVEMIAEQAERIGRLENQRDMAEQLAAEATKRAEAAEREREQLRKRAELAEASLGRTRRWAGMVEEGGDAARTELAALKASQATPAGTSEPEDAGEAWEDPQPLWRRVWRAIRDE